jgi:aspartyl-tRNA(Asn)/glutamyl-tRNA(Gln) amidotransferase subunit B
VERVRRELPELPAAKRSRYVEVLGVAEAAAEVLTQHPAVAAFFEEAAASGLPVKAANFVVSEVLRDTTTHGMAANFPVTASQVAGALRLVEAGTIRGKQAKGVYGQLVADARGGKPARTAASVRLR